jgi:hypothetical protein
MQIATTVNIVQQEGFLALYSGLVPALSRGLFYGGRLVPPAALLCRLCIYTDRFRYCQEVLIIMQVHVLARTLPLKQPWGATKTAPITFSEICWLAV